jgi:CubicO group peptidase (beta-lactamase class C family)
MNLEALIQSARDQNLHVLHIVVRQQGKIIAEHEFSKEAPDKLWSVSKTFTSMAVGIAAHEGYFDIHDKCRLPSPTRRFVCLSFRKPR